MAVTYYKYAERDADSQVNWAEVGKGLTDMLAETNRVRQDKKDALDAAQRETMKYLAETPNGEHVGARESILEYANMASNQMRIMKQLMQQGQLDVKDYTIFRQNLTDNTNLAFNANKLYQEKYSDVMKGVADKKYSQLYADNFSEVSQFGDWRNIGWQIAPNGVVMSGKMIEQEIDGKKVRTLDKTPGALRSMDYLNQSLVSQVDFYNYEDRVNDWVKTLGKEKTITEIDLGGIERKGKITSRQDITSRKDLKPGTTQILYTFIDAENKQIDSIVGDPLDATRVLVDSAIFSPNGEQYGTTTSEEEAKKNPNLILKVVDPNSGGFKYVLTDKQQEEANEFVRGQMRSKYNYEEDAEAVGATQRDESSFIKERNRKLFADTEEPKPTVTTAEILKIYGTNDKGKQVLTGITQALQNAIVTKIKGVDNVVEYIGYNRKNGALEISGVEVTGKAGTNEEVGVETTDASGEKITTPKKVTQNVTKQKKFVQNDLNNAGLLSKIVTQIPNPEDPNGGNFRNIAQAKDYYKRQYEASRGQKPIRFDAEGNIIK